MDGITRRAEPTVDGLPLDVHAGILELFRLASMRGAMAGDSGAAQRRSGGTARPSHPRGGYTR